MLRFDAYYKEPILEAREAYHLRKVKVLYFLEDDSMSLIEPTVENSGIPQGVFLKRQKMPKNATEYYSVQDLNVDIPMKFYGREFHIVSCDQFTKVIGF